ncbi:MAG TPA: hypothetical protein VD998_00345 [Verrucomicrobiae bacterium]|nr:hypothetical protein [Verrucomicrobiae bacterium]
MQVTRRECVVTLVAAGLSAACGSNEESITPTSPSSTSLPPQPTSTQPLNVVTAPNGTRATLRYYGYTTRDNMLLVDAMRANGLNPRPDPNSTSSLITMLGNDNSKPEWGWMFYIENQFFGQEASTVRIANRGQLWAAYEKLSRG